MQASSKTNTTTGNVGTLATLCMNQSHRVVEFHHPEPGSEGLHAAAPRVERAIYREKEALPAGQRQ